MTKRRPTANSTYKKLAVQCSAGTFVVNQTFVLRMNICGKNRQLLVAAKRYRKPYDDTTNIKLTDMERTILDTITDRLTTKPTSQHNEVLFFTTAHFLFFNFLPTAQNTLSFFLLTLNQTRKKMKECFSTRNFQHQKLTLHFRFLFIYTPFILINI